MVSTVRSWSRVAGLSKRCRKIERRIYAMQFISKHGLRLIECSTRLERRDSNTGGEVEVMVKGEDEGEDEVLEGGVLTVFASVEA